MVSLRKHLRVALTLCPKKNPLVAYVGAASGDNAGFQRMIGAEITKAGGRVRAAKLVAKSSKTSTARALLEDCDAVFVSGGDVLAGMSVLADRDMISFFHGLAKEGRPMIGISAGSIMLARSWVHFPESDHEHAVEGAVVFPCLGIAPVYVDAHAEEDEWVELRTLLQLLHARGDDKPLGYGLTCKGAIRVDHDEKGGARVTALGTHTPKFVVKGKKVALGAPLRLGASEPAASPRYRLSKAPARRRPAKR